MSQSENGEVNDFVPENQHVSEREIVRVTLQEQYEEKTAGFWMRLWAFAIDSLIASSIVGIFINPIFHLFDWSLSDSNWYAPIAVISGLIYYSYFVVMTKIWQQTIGKMVFGIKVKTINGEKLNWGTVIFREVVGRFINNTIPVLYIIIAFMPNNKSIQDIIADTIVVHEKVYIKSKKEIIEAPNTGNTDVGNPITPSV